MCYSYKSLQSWLFFLSHKRDIDSFLALKFLKVVVYLEICKDYVCDGWTLIIPQSHKTPKACNWFRNSRLGTFATLDVDNNNAGKVLVDVHNYQVIDDWLIDSLTNLANTLVLVLQWKPVLSRHPWEPRQCVIQGSDKLQKVVDLLTSLSFTIIYLHTSHALSQTFCTWPFRVEYTKLLGKHALQTR